MTTRKITIQDDDHLRAALDARYAQTDPVTLAKWALALAEHLIVQIGLEASQFPAIAAGFAVNEQWQRGAARMHDVRQAGFAIHRLAKAQTTELGTTIFRVIGQAVATGHMREHAMVASDYAIKVVNLQYPGDLKKVTAERQSQIDLLAQLSQAGEP